MSPLLRNNNSWVIQISASYPYPNRYPLSSWDCTRSTHREIRCARDWTQRLHLWTSMLILMVSWLLRWDSQTSNDDLWDDLAYTIFCNILFLTILEEPQMVDKKWILCVHPYLFHLSLLCRIYPTLQSLVARTLDLSGHCNPDDSIWVIDDIHQKILNSLHAYEFIFSQYSRIYGFNVVTQNYRYCTDRIHSIWNEDVFWF